MNSFVRRAVGSPADATPTIGGADAPQTRRRAEGDTSRSLPGFGSIANHGLDGVLWYTLAALVSWYLWAAVAYWIGTRLLPGAHTEADHGQLLRTLGFSSAPGLLRIFGLFPPLALFAFLLSTAWMLVAMVVAVRQALDYCTTGRAIAVCAIGFPFYAIGLALSLLLLGPWPI